MPMFFQINAASEAPPRYIKVLVFGRFWEQHRRALSHAQWVIRCSWLLLCALWSWEHVELALQAHVAQQALSKLPAPVNRSLPPICSRGIWKFNTCLQVSFLKGAGVLSACLESEVPKYFLFFFFLFFPPHLISTPLDWGFCYFFNQDCLKEQKGSSLPSFSWTSWRLRS